MPKVGILVTDRVRSELVDHHGEYGDMFRRQLLAVDPALSFRDYDVIGGERPRSVRECDAYVITGSRHGVNDGLGWIAALEAFVLQLIAARWPLLAVCFGHQLVARALGGETGRAPHGWTLGLQRTRLAAPFPWAAPTEAAQGFVQLIHSHQDQVTRLPDCAQLLGGNALCPISMYRVGDHVMSLQGHLEFSLNYAAGLYDLRRDSLGERAWAEARASLSGHSDADLVARWAARFLRGAGAVEALSSAGLPRS